MATTLSPAQQREMDGVELGLLTCSPGKEIYSYYGHTAIRYKNEQRGIDVAINYGLFNYHRPHFIIRFVFGLCDYEMGVTPFENFLSEYIEDGRGVVEQRLRLTADEKFAILNALAINAEDANKVYRYNFFYDNCSSRARDMLVDHIRGKVVYRPHLQTTNSYRVMVHQWNANHPWSSFGCDLLLGVGADRSTNLEQQQFLPDSLRASFANAVVLRPGMKELPLIDSTWTVLPVHNVDKSHNYLSLLTPKVAFALLAILLFIVACYEIKQKKVFGGIDFLMLFVDGVAGFILFSMIFSKHPTVSLNFQIFALNPLSLLMCGLVVWAKNGHALKVCWKILTFCLLLFFICNIWQDYAEGMNFLALCLLERCTVNICVSKYKESKR